MPMMDVRKMRVPVAKSPVQVPMGVAAGHRWNVFMLVVDIVTMVSNSYDVVRRRVMMIPRWGFVDVQHYHYHYHHHHCSSLRSLCETKGSERNGAVRRPFD